MRIAVWHNLPSGGARRALHEHVRGLVSRGHSVEAWCPPTADRDFLPFGPEVREHVVDLQWPAIPRASDQLQMTLHVRRQIEAMDAHCRACGAAIEAGSFDVVFANTCTFFAASAIGRFVQTPAVMYLQEPNRELYEALPRLRWLARPAGEASLTRPSTYRSTFVEVRELRNLRVKARYELDNAGSYRRILVNSDFSRESVLRAYGCDAEVCYLGVDSSRFVDQGLPRENYVVGLGAINPLKRLDFCIEALGLLPEPRPKLIWIGNIATPKLLPKLRQLAGERGVAFEPMIQVSNDELLNVLNRASVMVYAPRLEPFGLAPLEANACGVPVVAVAEGGVRETMVDGVNGLLVPGDPGAMAAAVGRLLADPALARQLGRNARKAVQERWSHDAGTDRIERALTACATAH